MTRVQRIALSVLIAAVSVVIMSLVWWSEPTGEMQPSPSAALEPGSASSPPQETIASDGILLRWDFTEGTTYRWSFTLTIQLEAPQGDNLVKGGIQMTFDVDVNASEVTQNDAELQFSIVRVRARSDLPDMEVEYDSANNAPVDESDLAAEAISAVFTPFLDVRIVAQANPRGVIESVQLDAATEELKQGLEMIRPFRSTAIMLEAEGLNSMYFGGVISFPKEPVSVGDNWSETFTAPESSAFGSLKMDFSSRYVGSANVGGDSLEQFDLDVAMALENPYSTMVKLGEQESSGTMYFDRRSGQVLHTDWTVDSEMIFNDGEAKGRWVLGLSSIFGPKTDDDTAVPIFGDGGKSQATTQNVVGSRGKDAPSAASSEAPPVHDKQQLQAIEQLKRLRADIGYEGTGASRTVSSVSLRGEYDARTATDDDLASLLGLPDLRKLDLSRNPISDAGLVHLKALSNLEDVNLSYTPVTDDGLEHLKGLTSLRVLWLRGARKPDPERQYFDTHITDAGLVHLEGLTELRELGLMTTEITDAGLAQLKGLTSLTSLYLGFTQISDDGVYHLQGLTNIQDLGLSHTGVTDAGLTYLKGMTNLRELDLADTKTTDEAVVYLQRFTNLQSLDLRHNNITDAAIVHLKEMTALRSLYLYETQISDEGIEELERSLPDCLVGG